MDFLPEKINHYAESHTSLEGALLQKISRETHLHVLKPRMLSGHLQGRTLAMLSRMLQPENILEIGTYTGYASLCLAEGLSNTGQLVTIDINAELENRVKGYFQESVYKNQIQYLIGNALEIIPKLKQSWDLVFIDADKENYLTYYNLVLPNIKKGGIILADNVLWSGKVMDETQHDHDTKKIREFNETIQSDDRVENVLLPIRDGLMIIRKK